LPGLEAASVGGSVGETGSEKGKKKLIAIDKDFPSS
jgi:hypothetical protein